jgi:hypothetical protein
MTDNKTRKTLTKTEGKAMRAFKSAQAAGETWGTRKIVSMQVLECAGLVRRVERRGLIADWKLTAEGDCWGEPSSGDLNATPSPAPEHPTSLQMSAVYFVAALAEDVDRRRGIVTPNGSKATQAKVIAVVRDAFFCEESPHDASKK